MQRNHTRSRVVALAAAAILSLGTAPAIAQTQGSPAPRGSYLQSCSAISYSNGVLTAACRTGKYDAPFTSIEPAYCADSGDIANLNGRLVCPAKAGTWGKGAATPPGSYKQSCRDIDVRPGPTLVASCADNNGSYSPAQLDLNLCQAGRAIGNQYGQLICFPKKVIPKIHIPG